MNLKIRVAINGSELIREWNVWRKSKSPSRCLPNLTQLTRFPSFRSPPPPWPSRDARDQGWFLFSLKHVEFELVEQPLRYGDCWIEFRPALDVCKVGTCDAWFNSVKIIPNLMHVFGKRVGWRWLWPGAFGSSGTACGSPTPIISWILHSWHE